MQYLVKASGEVLNQQSKAYIVKASSEEEAQLIAKNSFEGDFFNISGEVVTKSYPRNKLAYLSFVLMGFAIFLSFIGWKTGHDTISIRPNLSSCLYSVFIYSAFVIRIKGIERTTSSWIDIVLGLLNVLLLASFIQIVVIDSEVSFLGLFNIPINTTYLIAFALLLSWLGLKFISVLCMGLVCILALCNINLLNDAMGSLWGTVYVLCSFFGILTYLRNEPAIYEIEKNTKRVSTDGLNYLRHDLHEAKADVIHFEHQIKQNVVKQKIEKKNGEMDTEKVSYEKSQKK